MFIVILDIVIANHDTAAVITIVVIIVIVVIVVVIVAIVTIVIVAGGLVGFLGIGFAFGFFRLCLFFGFGYQILHQFNIAVFGGRHGN